MPKTYRDPKICYTCKNFGGNSSTGKYKCKIDGQSILPGGKCDVWELDPNLHHEVVN